MRSMVLRALFVCRVPKTSRPVSAAVSASEMVSRSRISPTSTMSASSRKRRFQSDRERSESLGTSRCVMMLRLLSCTNSIGSSIVTMCRAKFLVDVIDQRRQRRRFARAGRAGDEDESTAQMAELLHYCRDAELLEGRDLCRDKPKDSAVAVRLFQKIAAEPRCLIHLVGKIEIAAFPRKTPNFSARRFRSTFTVASSCVTGSSRMGMTSPCRRIFGGWPFADMQIGGAFLYQQLEKLIDDTASVIGSLGSSHLQMCSHLLLLFGARVGFLGTDQSLLMKLA